MHLPESHSGAAMLLSCHNMEDIWYIHILTRYFQPKHDKHLSLSQFTSFALRFTGFLTTLSFTVFELLVNVYDFYNK